jgi:hypothetical protein
MIRNFLNFTGSDAVSSPGREKGADPATLRICRELDTSPDIGRHENTLEHPMHRVAV